MDNLRSLLAVREPFWISPDTSVLDATKTLTTRRFGTCAVYENGQLVGVFSERDLAFRVVAEGLDPASTPVRAVMTRGVAVADIDDSYDTCILKMTRAGCRHLPVLDKGRFAGMVSMRDLMNAHAAELEAEMKSLRAYVTETGSA
jgi:CBS domain-containing protein